MEQNIQFKGIANTPSDHEASDGELGTCLNLVPEDGALKPIYNTTSATTLKDGCTIRFVHKVTHGEEIHSHYIISDGDGRWYYVEKDDLEGAYNEINIINGEDVKSISAVGTILCFVSDDHIQYAIWSDDAYSVFDRNSFKFSIQIKLEDSTTTTSNSTYYGSDFGNYISTYAQGSGKYVAVITATNARKIFTDVDASVNKYLSDKGTDRFKYIVFGVAAMRLYDGTIINISNIFTLAPNVISNDLTAYGKDKTFSISPVYTYKAYAIIKSDIPDSLSKLIQGVDVFLTNGETFLDVDKEYKHEGLTDQNNFSAAKFSLDFMSDDKFYDAFEALVFRKSISFNVDDFGKKKYLTRPVGTEENISMADFSRKSFGGADAFVYNNRMHISNVTERNTGIIGYTAIKTFNVRDENKVIGDENFHKVLGYYPDLRLDSFGRYLYDYDNVEMIMSIIVNGAKEILDYGKLSYPIDPVITIPLDNVTLVTLYIKFKDNIEDDHIRYWYTEFRPHKSDNLGASIFVHRDTHGLPCYFQLRYVRFKESNVGGGSGVPNYYFLKDLSFMNNTKGWYETTSNKWDSLLLNYKKQNIANRFPSLIRVSEAENPLVFPAANSVQVGSSQVRALAANTHAISEGQFGTAPLYAFTDEGVWALITSGQGTYEARQPVNRDVVTNPDGIISTDDAVLYPTKRGIMLIQGSTAQCITDTLRGKPFQFTELFNKEFAKKVLKVADIPEESVTYLDFDEFLDNADMAFDYKDNRLILYNNKASYAYVFSMKSQMWGAMECDFKYNINVYPDAYVVDKNNFIKDIHNDNPTEDTRYIVCTRPLTLGQPEQFKTMLTTIVRGYFRNRPGKCGIVLYGSNDLFNWFPIASSINQYLRGMAGSPYKYFRVAITGSLAVDESISNFTTDFINRWGNKLR